MSRLGKKPIPITAGVKVILNGEAVRIEGPKGALSRVFASPVTVGLIQDGKFVQVGQMVETREAGRLCGTARSLIANMIKGVVDGYQIVLDIVGVGYTAKLEGKTVVLQLGFCDPCKMAIPAELKLETPTATRMVVSGCDKQLVGEFAAELRRLRPPEPYKGKGIKYEREQIRRKAGKALAGAQA